MVMLNGDAGELVIPAGRPETVTEIGLSNPFEGVTEILTTTLWEGASEVAPETAMENPGVGGGGGGMEVDELPPPPHDCRIRNARVEARDHGYVRLRTVGFDICLCSGTSPSRARHYTIEILQSVRSKAGKAQAPQLRSLNDG